MLHAILCAGLLFAGSALAGIPKFRQPVEMVSSAWYAGWHGTDFPPSKVSWEKYTQMTYAFAYIYLSESMYYKFRLIRE